MIEQFCLDGISLTPVATAGVAEISSETVMTFEQSGSLVTGRYRGGAIVEGYLIGYITGSNFLFRYVQTDTSGHLDAGVSNAILEDMGDGRIRMTEHFQWATRPTTGTNIFEQTRSCD
jgi:hypothetical protein